MEKNFAPTGTWLGSGAEVPHWYRTYVSLARALVTTCVHSGGGCECILEPHTGHDCDDRVARHMWGVEDHPYVGGIGPPLPSICGGYRASSPLYMWGV